MRLAPLAFAAAAALLLPFAPSIARASGDWGCTPAVMPASDDYGYGCAGTALLTPANDTRINLVLLMADRHGGLRAYPPKREPLEAPPLPVPLSWEDFVARIGPAGSTGDEPEGWVLQGEGTVCVSNDAGTEAFVAALGADRGVSADEREHLAAARRQAGCAAEGGAPAPLDPALGASVRSASGKAFLAYLQAAAAFYAGDRDAAAFVALAKSKQPWVREAARYMVGRTWALAAQANGFGEYGELAFDKMDRAALDKAESALKDYLRDYPRGAYAASAQGLLRRVYWLGQDLPKLAAAYRAQIEQADAAQRNLPDLDLAQEIDAKLPAEAYRLESAGPVLLAVDDLRRMRRNDSDKSGKRDLGRDELMAQRARFASMPGLHDYLLAAYAFFVDGSPKAALERLPAEDAGKGAAFDALAFSRRTLRALALDRVDDPKAREAFVALFPRATAPLQGATLQLALAMHDERHGHLDRVFAAGSPVTDPELREILLVNVAGPDLLRARIADTTASARERGVARYVLLYKSLTRGRYAEFLAAAKGTLPPPTAEPDRYFKLDQAPPLGDFAWTGTQDGYRCPSLVAVATTLAKTPADVHAALCLGEFARLNGYDGFFLDRQPSAGELGGSPTQFPGKPFARQAIYQRVMADAAASPQDRAYALYRAVNCYAPSGANDCGGEDVPVATRKAWFTRLKREFPTSPWAQSLQYYW